MVFVTGPLYAGKQTFAMAQWGLAAQDFSADPAAPCPAVRDVQELAACAPDLEALADRLSRKALVLATELGGGVVPMDPAQRAAREAAGRLACLLAARAETVVQVWCGLPLVLKGTLPLRLLYQYLTKHQSPERRDYITNIDIKFRYNLSETDGFLPYT